MKALFKTFQNSLFKAFQNVISKLTLTRIIHCSLFHSPSTQINVLISDDVICFFVYFVNFLTPELWSLISLYLDCPSCFLAHLPLLLRASQIKLISSLSGLGNFPGLSWVGKFSFDSFTCHSGCQRGMREELRISWGLPQRI